MENSEIFKNELDKRVEKVEQIIKKYMPDVEGYASTVEEAMNYAVDAGGKRLRPLMMMESHILVDEMQLFAMDMKSRVTFISRAKV